MDGIQSAILKLWGYIRQNHISFVEFVTVSCENKHFSLLNACYLLFAWAPKIKLHKDHGSLRVCDMRGVSRRAHDQCVTYEYQLNGVHRSFVLLSPVFLAPKRTRESKTKRTRDPHSESGFILLKNFYYRPKKRDKWRKKERLPGLHILVPGTNLKTRAPFT